MKKKKISLKEMVFQVCMVVLFLVIAVVCFYPFYYVLIVSLSDSSVPVSQIKLLPVQFTLSNFAKVFGLKGMWQSFLVSVLRTVIGTVVTLFFTSILAFCLIHKELPCRKFFYRFAVVSMYVNAGLIPWYLTMRTLHMKDTFLAYILPMAVSVYSMVLIKTFMESIPSALEDAALIDGAGYFTVYLKVILPMCTPVLASVAVFTAVGHWNSWTDNLLLVDSNNLRTLQLTLMEYLNQANDIANQAAQGGNDQRSFHFAIYLENDHYNGNYVSSFIGVSFYAEIFRRGYHVRCSKRLTCD